MKRKLTYLLLAFVTLGIIGLCAGLGLYMWASQDLVSITRVHDYRPAQVTTVYADDGTIMGYFYKEKRFLRNLDQISPNIVNAILATEDKDFYSHPGVSLKGILRAFIQNVLAGKTVSGGSTITQQIIKRVLLTPEKDYRRKAQEAILAYRLEQYLTKDEILYIYLNQIYLGHNSYGVEAAARTYFGKHSDALTIAEAAVIANLPKAPSGNNPYDNPALAKAQQRNTLGNMLKEKMITQQEYEAALAEELVYKRMPEPSWGLGAWYLEEVRRELISILSEDNVRRLGVNIDVFGEDAVYTAGLHVYTAMNMHHQKSAEVALRAGLHESARRSGWHGPISHIEPAEIEKFISDSADFTPEMLANAGWARAVITSVDKNGADARMGAYSGRLPVQYMGWCRVPNLRVSPEGAGVVKDATKVLVPGDVVWVSAIGATGTTNPVGVPANPEDKKNPVPEFNPSAITPETPIPLCLEQLPQVEGAVASIDLQKGDLVALVGGYQFSTASQFNRASQALRQPGSSFKPIVYSAALDYGFTPGTILQDTPFELHDPWTKKVWAPKNFDGKFLGPMILRTALALSRNVCTVRVAAHIGMPAVVQRAHDLGIEGDIPAVLAISLGSWEVTPLGMAEAYSAFANQGVYVKPRKIITIANAWNEPILRTIPDERQAITPQNAFVMATLLKEVVNAGTATRAKILGRPIAGKTGTSNEERAAWFIGFSPYLVTSVYVGHDDHSPMGRLETGGRAALPIFIDYRKEVDHLYEPTDFVQPGGISFMSVANGEKGTLSLPFIAGTEGNIGFLDDYGDQADTIEAGEDIMRQMMF